MPRSRPTSIVTVNRAKAAAVMGVAVVVDLMDNRGRDIVTKEGELDIPKARIASRLGLQGVKMVIGERLWTSYVPGQMKLRGQTKKQQHRQRRKTFINSFSWMRILCRACRLTLQLLNRRRRILPRSSRRPNQVTLILSLQPLLPSRH